jgi:hypothetical protein
MRGWRRGVVSDGLLTDVEYNTDILSGPGLHNAFQEGLVVLGNPVAEELAGNFQPELAIAVITKLDRLEPGLETLGGKLGGQIFEAHCPDVTGG